MLSPLSNFILLVVPMYKREECLTLCKRLQEPRKFLQVIMGPRQIGKTTAIKQALKELEAEIPHLFFSADNVPAIQNSWISNCWATARAQMSMDQHKTFILVMDEIQKLKSWSEVVKKEWDDDTFNDRNLIVVLLGSSRVMLQKGLADSLAGRFETIRMTHWSYPEMRDAFGMTLEQYLYFGGYPGAASLIDDSERWRQYIRDSIVDATINKDILYDTVIGKPALLRQTFELGASYSGQILSLTKMVGALQDAGNTTTLSGYLNILKESGLMAGLQKFSMDHARRRASIPKFQVFNSALRNVFSEYTLEEALRQPKVWGHFFESAVGSHLISNAFIGNYDIYYWREDNLEVDYILRKNDKLVAIEVKSGNETMNTGLAAFRKMYAPFASLVVGQGGMDVERFLSVNPMKLFDGFGV